MSSSTVLSLFKTTVYVDGCHATTILPLKLMTKITLIYSHYSLFRKQNMKIITFSWINFPWEQTEVTPKQEETSRKI
jgi:hypothetical protein